MPDSFIFKYQNEYPEEIVKVFFEILCQGLDQSRYFFQTAVLLWPADDKEYLWFTTVSLHTEP